MRWETCKASFFIGPQGRLFEPLKCIMTPVPLIPFGSQRIVMIYFL